MDGWIDKGNNEYFKKNKAFTELDHTYTKQIIPVISIVKCYQREPEVNFYNMNSKLTFRDTYTSTQVIGK